MHPVQNPLRLEPMLKILYKLYISFALNCHPMSCEWKISLRVYDFDEWEYMGEAVVGNLKWYFVINKIYIHLVFYSNLQLKIVKSAFITSLKCIGHGKKMYNTLLFWLPLSFGGCWVLKLCQKQDKETAIHCNHSPSYSNLEIRWKFCSENLNKEIKKIWSYMTNLECVVIRIMFPDITRDIRCNNFESNVPKT